jgi:hypothetical protein
MNFFAEVADRTNLSTPRVDPGPHYYRILDYVRVPSRYVGTDTLLDPAVFNDDPNNTGGQNSTGGPDDIPGPADPRYALQPPFNKVSRQRDPGRVNLNTVVGRRLPETASEPLQIWSEVYDGIMHRYRDDNLYNTTTGNLVQLGHFGPAWRDVVLSRRGHEQLDANGDRVDTTPSGAPDTLTFGLNSRFPSVFSNPFRSPEAGDLVPIVALQQHGSDASWLRSHPRNRWNDRHWGVANMDDDNNGLFDDAGEAGFGDDRLSVRMTGAIPEEEFGANDDRESVPLFSDVVNSASFDAERNPAMQYQPMTRLGNLVTTRSGVYAIWVTVGYFEVEPAPDWNTNENNVQEKFGGDGNVNSARTIAARALYDRVYPEGYMLAREVGSDTGDARRQRMFSIVDRTEEVGFKPGEDLNVERMIRVKRRVD